MPKGKRKIGVKKQKREAAKRKSKRKSTKKSKPSKLPYKEVANPKKVTQAEAATGPVTLPDNEVVVSAPVPVDDLPTDDSRDHEDNEAIEEFEDLESEEDDIDEGLF